LAPEEYSLVVLIVPHSSELSCGEQHTPLKSLGSSLS